MPDLSAGIPAAHVDTIVVEADSAEAALAEVTRRLGPAAEIVEAGKVRRGGVAGFFARELVQLHARVRPADQVAARGGAGERQVPAGSAPQAESGQPAARPDGGGGLDRLLAELTASTGDQERTFAEVLRAEQSRVWSSQETELENGQASGGSGASSGAGGVPASALQVTAEISASTAPAPAPAQRPEPASDLAGDPLPEPRPGPAWSARNLQNLGLPALVVDAVRGCDPAEDVQWVTAIAQALATLCRPLPAGSCVYVGPRSRQSAEAAGATVLRVGERVPATAAFAVASRATSEVREWLDRKRGRRWLHLVVGDEGWRDFLFDEPMVVSWSSRHDLCEAIRISAELGLVLGSGPMPWRGGEHRRAVPVEMAMAIRDLLPQS